MPYTVDVTPGAAHDLDRLSIEEVCDVDDVLAALAEDPRQEGCAHMGLPMPLWQCTIGGAIRLSYIILERSKTLVVTDVERLARW